MFQYLEKYNNLPASLKNRISSPAIAAAIKNLEFKYGLSLATIVMRVMIKDILADNILSYLLIEEKMSPSNARELTADLKHSVFYSVSDYIYNNAEADFYEKNQTELKQKNETIIIPPSTPPVIDPPSNRPEAEKIASELGVSFGSSELNDRLLKIIDTYLKGIRNKIATKDALMKKIENGGLSFDEITADKLISLCSAINNFDPVAAIKNFAVRDVEYDFSALKSKKEKVIEEQEEDVEEEKLLTGPALPAIQAEKEIKVVPIMPKANTADIAWPQNKPTVLPKIEPVVEKVIENKVEPIINIPKNDAGRVEIRDIKNRPRTFSPIDELAFMTIKNFRQLNSDPAMAADLVRRKIEAIASDDYTRKIEAINAWKVSPVNRMYVQVLKDALNSGMSATKALAKRLKEEPEFLNETEFEAVIQLNRFLSSGK